MFILCRIRQVINISDSRLIAKIYLGGHFTTFHKQILIKYLKLTCRIWSIIADHFNSICDMTALLDSIMVWQLAVTWTDVEQWILSVLAYRWSSAPPGLLIRVVREDWTISSCLIRYSFYSSFMRRIQVILYSDALLSGIKPSYSHCTGNIVLKFLEFWLYGHKPSEKIHMLLWPWPSSKPIPLSLSLHLLPYTLCLSGGGGKPGS